MPSAKETLLKTIKTVLIRYYDQALFTNSMRKLGEINFHIEDHPKQKEYFGFFIEHVQCTLYILHQLQSKNK